MLKIDFTSIENRLYDLAFPTIYFTKDSPKKFVRMLGQIATIPLFPYTVLIMFSMLSMYSVFVVISSLIDVFQNWYKNV